MCYDFNKIVHNLPSGFKPRNVKMFESHIIIKEKSQNQRRQKAFIIVEANLDNVSGHFSNNCDPAISFYHSVLMIFPPLLFMSPVRVRRFWCCLCPCQSSVRPWRWPMPSDATIRENLVLHPSGDEKSFVTPPPVRRSQCPSACLCKHTTSHRVCYSKSAQTWKSPPQHILSVTR